MDVSALRYPVATWTGPPQHAITAIAIAFPQAALYADQERLSAQRASKDGIQQATPQRRPSPEPAVGATGIDSAVIESGASRVGGTSVPGIAESPPLSACPLSAPPHAYLLSGSATGELANWYIPSYKSASGKGRKPVSEPHALAIPSVCMLGTHFVARCQLIVCSVVRVAASASSCVVAATRSCDSCSSLLLS
jgi:hypothetical protein